MRGVGFSGRARRNTAELARIERLRHVVVGADLETGDAIGVVSARRQHDDRQIVRRANAPAHLEAVHPRQHHVEQHDVEVARGLAELRERGAAVLDVREHHLVTAEVVAQETREISIVVDQERADHVARCRGTRRARP
jgi:hypothetical protein